MLKCTLEVFALCLTVYDTIVYVMKLSRASIIAIVFVFSVGSFAAGWALSTDDATYLQSQSITPGTATGTSYGPSSPIRIPILGDVWEKLLDFYYDESKLDLKKLEAGATKGFVAAINDPYTVFMTPEESKDFTNDLEGELEGIGAELEVKNGKLIVVAPLKNSPAEKAGIKPGDIIFKINGGLAQDMTLYEAVRRIRGKQGTQVTLTIVRETLANPFDLTITRSAIQIDSITLKRLDGDIFHLAINQFNDHTKREFETAVEKIILEKAKGLIIDVRGNGGGYLDISIDILSELISGKKPVVTIKKRDPKQNEVVQTSGSGRLADIPLAILVDKGSASASEIVAGAVQDYKRGVLIGEKTFGKGSVQQIETLGDGSSLRITIAKWFTPLDRSIDEIGITPDKEVKLTDQDVDAPVGRSNTVASPRLGLVEKKLDPQLDEAVKYLRNTKR